MYNFLLILHSLYFMCNCVDTAFAVLYVQFLLILQSLYFMYNCVDTAFAALYAQFFILHFMPFFLDTAHYVQFLLMLH